jgi:hypothetical protein
LPAPTTKPGRHRRHLPRERVPTARLPERGLRDSEDHEPPLVRPRRRGGERLATDKRQSSVNGAEKRSLHAAPLPGSIPGRGRTRKAEYCPSQGKHRPPSDSALKRRREERSTNGQRTEKQVEEAFALKAERLPARIGHPKRSRPRNTEVHVRAEQSEGVADAIRAKEDDAEAEIRHLDEDEAKTRSSLDQLTLGRHRPTPFWDRVDRSEALSRRS